MQSFKVRKTSSEFPGVLSGTIIPDTGYSGYKFRDQADRYRSTGVSLIALFLAEYGGVQNIADLHNYNQSLIAIVSFGKQSIDSQSIYEDTHFEIVSRQLYVPLLQLAKPSGYPNLNDGWLDCNPLSYMFNTAVILSFDGTVATFEPISSLTVDI